MGNRRFGSTGGGFAGFTTGVGSGTFGAGADVA